MAETTPSHAKRTEGEHIRGPALIDRLMTRHRGAVVVTCVICWLFPHIAFAFTAGSRWVTAPFYALLALILAPAGYAVGYLPTRFQAWNPFCSKRMLDFFCQVGFYFFGVASVLAAPVFLVLVVLSLTLRPDLADASGQPPIGSAAGFAVAYGAYRVRQKYVLGETDKSGETQSGRSEEGHQK